MSATSIDEGKLEAFMGQAVTDMGAIISAPLMVIGEKLGLYKAMAHAGPLTAAEVAERSGAAERYVREWLGNQAAGGYVTYDPDSDRYTLPDEHALALADEDSPFYILGVYELDRLAVRGRRQAPRRVQERRGHGLARARPPPLPRHRALLPARLPRAPRGRLDPGAGGRPGEARKAAPGWPTSAAATAPRRSSWPRPSRTPSSSPSTTTGPRSSARARRRAEAGVEDRITFGVAAAKDFPGNDYDLVSVFDCLHDMGDPVGAARARARDARRRRHLDDRRAVRRRQRAGEPQPGGPRSSTAPRR